MARTNRLGKIQKHLLVWALRQHTSLGIERALQPDDAKTAGEPVFVAKSGAILSYLREIGYTNLPKHTVNIRQFVPADVYNRMHVAFTNALKRLAENGLIEYKPLQCGTKQSHAENAYNMVFRVAKRSRKENGYRPASRERRDWKTARRSVYCLRPSGAKVARSILTSMTSDNSS